jgi:type I restriction enzyme, R subunit
MQAPPHHQTPSYLEDDISKFPALKLLLSLGYHYLTPEEALKLRGGKNSNVILEEVLESQLRAINRIHFRGEEYSFTDSNILGAIRSLKEVVFDGLVRTNEKIYDLLTLGKAMEQTNIWDKKSFNLNYIDWKHPENNIFHVTQEFEVSKSGSFDTRRPDLVLFVNGIPFVVIECKRPDLRSGEPLREAVSQQIRNQKEDEIPKLFIYSQILLALSGNDAEYGTCGTAAKFWAKWKELSSDEVKLKEVLNTSISDADMEKLFKDSRPDVRNYFSEIWKDERLLTDQDRVLYAMCRPERLLELSNQYIVFDGGIKKIARYQQYFAVQEALKRILGNENPNKSSQKKREGGVVWHTQGSGKSLTMVMLAKAIALSPDITSPRVILVTDRVDLDGQIYDTFKNCGKDVEQAKTGRDLVDILESKRSAIITTLIHKFTAGLKYRKFSDDSSNIFVLVDESHRTQYGAMNVAMQKVFPNACFIAFTGTPLKKKEKSTADKFGGFIGTPYTILDAVQDKAVVPILYEGRHVPQNVNDDAIDRWFERVTEHLSDEQKKDLKHKFATSDQLNQAEQKIKVIAYDVSEHFLNNWKGTGFKGQLVTPTRLSALLYKKYLDECGYVSSDVLVSSPDTREGHDDPEEDTSTELQQFWEKTLKRFGTEKKFNEEIISAFKNGEDPEIIIVVDKLLTGFDAPKNAVLYLTRGLKEHTLLQAIARVNRLYEGKEFGYVIDYYGVLGELDKALQEYSSWEDFDAKDLQGTITNVDKEAESLPQRHSELWDVFKSVRNKSDTEEYEQLLADEALREGFYEKLSLYARTLQLALSTVKFTTETSEKKIEVYKKDLRFFLNLRTSVQRRYAEKVDFREYETRVKKLVDTYVTSDTVTSITELVNIFDAEKFQAEVEKVTGEAAKADTIASRTKKTIVEKMQEDPAFYKRFSALLEEAIKAFRERRITEAQYLAQVTSIMESVRNRTGDDIPEELKDNEAAKAFFGTISEALKLEEEEPGYGKPDEKKVALTEIALEIDRIIRSRLVVDWIHKPDVLNQIKNDIDDYLFELKKKELLELSVEQIDRIMEQSIDIARHRYRQ